MVFSAVIKRLAQYISLSRLCCPFYSAKPPQEHTVQCSSMCKDDSSHDEAKFEKLKELYPHYDSASLQEVFSSCGQSSKKSKLFLNKGQGLSDGAHREPKKRNVSNYNDEVYGKPKYQKSIMSFFQGGIKSKSKSDFGAAIRVHSKPYASAKVPVSILKPGSTNISHLGLNSGDNHSNNIALAAVRETERVAKNRKSRTIYLNHEDASAHIPFLTFHKNILPSDVADRLLKYFLKDEKGYIKRQFHVHGKVAQTDHLQCAYTRQKDNNLHYYSGVAEGTKEYTDLINEAEKLVAKKVNEEIKKRRRLKYQSTEAWKGDMCVVNKYEKRGQTIDWHSDRLTYLGPHCIIASLSLGASRPFCIRNYVKDPGNDEQITYSIALTHNSLAIMHAGFQEKYQHSVKSSLNDKNHYEPHPVLGQIRINLTFRNRLMEDSDIETCQHCGAKMMMRMVTKGKNVGRYMWLCTGSQQGLDCSGFKWAKYD